MEVYTALFDKESNQIDGTKALIINNETFLPKLEKNKIVFFGNGAEKCRETINHKNAIFLSDVFPLASVMALPVHKQFDNSCFEDVAYFEPFYLKDFIATIPKNRDFRK
jgi:tRNA threonylcarbamoyladenosine biosynthesis protein TsaB